MASNDTSDQDKDETLFVLSAPSINNSYYKSVFEQIIDYMVNFVHIVRNQNDVIILVDRATMSSFEGKVPDDVLIEANITDIWIRDFAPVLPSRQIKFRYAPKYHKTSQSLEIDQSFEQWFSDNALTFENKSEIILDGGNVVDNPEGSRVVLTDRILKENRTFNKEEMKIHLQNLLDVRQVAIIPEIPDDTTGHADGMVMWVNNTKLLLHDMPEPQRSQIRRELENSFPEVEIVEVPDYFEYSTWKGFVSACNIFVNSVVTDRYIYMPTFNGRHDQSMLELIQSHTDRKVIGIPAEKVCFMGGSVRCLSWQVKGDLKDKILSLIEEN